MLTNLRARFVDFVGHSRPSKHGIPWFPVVGDPCDPESSGLLSAGFPIGEVSKTAPLFLEKIP